MSCYKIVACDLDGTLLNSCSEVSCENINAICRLSKQGVVFAPCTGRTYSEIPGEIRKLARYIIYSNGAVVYDNESGNRILLNCIPNDVAKTALNIFDSCETHITFRQNGQCFVDAEFQDEASFQYYHVIVPHQVVIRDFAVHSDNFKEFLDVANDIEVFSVFFHNYNDKMNCKKLIEQTKVLKTVEASEYNLEIMSTEAGKGRALRGLADMLGISHAETIGMGDSDNDSSLIHDAGLGLAVSNSCEALKKLADEIICSNDEHAVQYVLNHYFKNS